MSDAGPTGPGRSAMAGLVLASMLAPLGSTMIAVALPSIAADLGTAEADLTRWLVASYLVAGIALQSPGGTLGDRFGHRRTLGLGLLLVAAGSVLGLVGRDVRILAGARVLMAAGGAAIIPAAMAMLRNLAPGGRARAYGTFGACMALAAAVGPLVGGELTPAFGWRAIFAANLPIVLVAGALLAASGTGSVPPAIPKRFDLVGSALLGLGLAGVVIGARPGGGGLAVPVAGAALLAVFPFWERRTPAPVVDLGLFRVPAFTAGGLIVALQNLAMYALLFQLPIFFKQVRGVEPREMGRALLAMTLAMVAGSLAGGRLAERLGARLQAALGSLLALGGLAWFLDFASISSPGQVLPGLLLLGAGLGLSSAPCQSSAMGGVPPERAGMAAGVLSTLRYLGGVAGIAVLGSLIAGSGHARAHQAPVIVYGGALVAAALLSTLLPGRTAIAGK